MRFAFRIGNHFGFSDGADDDLQGYEANFGALIDKRSPLRLIRLLYNAFMATRPSSLAWINKRLRRCPMRARSQRGLGSERDGCLASWNMPPLLAMRQRFEGRHNPVSGLS